MDSKKNDKYKKKFILKQIKNKWGYYEFDGNIVLVKNCILKEKYNKIYQLIFNGGDAIDGLYLINSFDINVEYKNDTDKFYRITNKKYDKIAGYDDCTIHPFKNKKELTSWLIKEEFLSKEDLSILEHDIISKKMFPNLEEFVLDC